MSPLFGGYHKIKLTQLAKKIGHIQIHTIFLAILNLLIFQKLSKDEMTTFEFTHFDLSLIECQRNFQIQDVSPYNVSRS